PEGRRPLSTVACTTAAPTTTTTTTTTTVSISISSPLLGNRGPHLRRPDRSLLEGVEGVGAIRKGEDNRVRDDGALERFVRLLEQMSRFSVRSKHRRVPLPRLRHIGAHPIKQDVRERVVLHGTAF